MKQNLLVISLDTLRADVAYSGKFKSIQKLRSYGVTFLNTVSSSPLTPCSHASVFTGLQPYNHGVRHLFREKLKRGTTTLAQILKSNGYKTKAIVSCPGMNKWYGFSKGFDSYDDEIPRLADGSDPLKTVDVKKRGTALKRANIVSERAIDWLEKNKKNLFFLFIHYFDAHWPYEAPEIFGGNNIYEQEVAYSDHYLNNVIDYLEKNHLIDSTTIVCFSDHGEDLNGLYPNDKGGKELSHPEENGHGCLLYNQTQKVVLIVKGKSIPKKIDYKNQVRLVDVLPTIVDILNLKSSLDKIDGKSLLPIIKSESDESRVAYSETFYPEEQAKIDHSLAYVKNKKAIIIDNKYKVIVNLEDDEQEVYNLLKDQNEKVNLLQK